MKSEEVGVLIKNKKEEGKDTPTIFNEIRTLKESQIIFKEQKREIQRLNKELEKIGKQLETLKEKQFREGLKPKVEVKEDKDNKNHTIKIMARILNILETENRDLTQTQLKDFCCTSHPKIVPCLMFLTKHNLIKKEITNGNVIVYSKLSLGEREELLLK